MRRHSLQNRLSHFILVVALMLVVMNMTTVHASVKFQGGNFAILAESTFDTDNEGWTIFNDGTAPAYFSTGGVDGGYISSTDLGTGIYWYWNAPAEFLGDKSAAYNGSLTFYLFQNNTTRQRNQDDILFIGGGTTLVYNTTYNPGTTWTSYSIPINETSSGWTNQANGLAPTQAEMQAVLANLESIHIRGEYRFGADTGGIDSVYLNSAAFTPTPTATVTPTEIPTNTPMPTATFTPAPTVTPTYYYGYLGSGYFPTNNLNFCNTGAYSQQTQNAASQWSADTDINMFDNCTTFQINVIYADFGNTNWAGRAHICNTSGQCDNSEAYNSTYSYCQVWLNSDAITGNPFFYTDAEVQKLIIHELGHCYSLAHSTDPTSVMGNGSVPNAQDIIMINARY